VTKGETTLQYERVVDQRGKPGIGLEREAPDEDRYRKDSPEAQNNAFKGIM
jgi:hypothetical protein